MLLKIFRICLDAKSEFNTKVKVYDLTFSQWQIIKTISLSEKGQLTLNEIVEKLNSDKATISIMIKKLKEKGMLVGTRDEKDKRKVHLTLTDKMKELSVEIKQVEEEVAESIFSNLTDEQIGTLTDVITTYKNKYTNK